MPDKPRPHDSDELRASIERLSRQSEELREASKKNAETAAEISAQLRAITRTLDAAKAKKTSKRLG